MLIPRFFYQHTVQGSQWKSEKFVKHLFNFTKNYFYEVFETQMLYCTHKSSAWHPCTLEQRLNLEIQARIAF